MKNLNIYLTGNKVATFVYPETINEKDIQIVQKVISELLQSEVTKTVCPDCKKEITGAAYKKDKWCHSCQKWQTVL